MQIKNKLFNKNTLPVNQVIQKQAHIVVVEENVIILV